MKSRAGTKAATIDEYLASLTADQRSALQALRRAIRAAAPRAEECISYSLPAFKLNGRIVLYFAGWNAHYSIYPITDRLASAMKKELSPYEMSGKGTVRFPLSKPVPVKVVSGIAKFRAREVAERARAARR